MEQPLVSILIPIFNVEKYIKRCLNSIFCQSYKHIEYIFLDDNTPDNSIKILQESIEENYISKSCYKLIRHKTNLGIAATRNDCLKYAQGEYVLFIDSDDWIDQNAVEELVSATNDSTIDIVGCDYIWEFKTGRSKIHKENYSNTCEQNLRKCINYEIGTVLWKLLVKRELFNRINFLENIDIGEDYVMSIKLYFHANNFIALHKPLYHYTQYNNERYSLKIEKSINDHIKAINEVEIFLKENNLYDKDIIDRILQRKFQIKSYFLTDKMYNYNLWLTTFPEANKAYREMTYNYKEKIKFWLADHKLLHFYKLLR